LLRGQSIVIGETWRGQEGSGMFLRRSPHAEVV
jgi:hypothetical protein